MWHWESGAGNVTIDVRIFAFNFKHSAASQHRRRSLNSTNNCQNKLNDSHSSSCSQTWTECHTIWRGVLWSYEERLDCAKSSTSLLSSLFYYYKFITNDKRNLLKKLILLIHELTSSLKVSFQRYFHEFTVRRLCSSIKSLSYFSSWIMW